MGAVNRATAEDMNALPGTEFPSGDIVEEPEGVLVAGDLTGDNPLNWTGYWLGRWVDGFDQLFPVDGQGICRFPTYEGYGNHDYERNNVSILSGIYSRNLCRRTPVNTSENGLHYSWDWKGIHFVNLNLYPGNDGYAEHSLDFLKHDLTNNLQSIQQPIILYHHYTYANNEDSWTAEEREQAYEAMKDHNIIAIFVGHRHTVYHKKWKDIDVYYVPETYHNQEYYVFRIQNNKLTINRRKNGQWNGYWAKSFKQ